MVNHFYQDAQLADDRRARLLREADTRRQANKLRVCRPTAHRRLLAGLGGWMIAQGERLKAGYESPARPANRRVETAR
ncbi:MAG: hypothetical protein HXY41_13905 [Chloroflexi bacterium]|nr:hypothetical protein [Chloroflexota bacterium]